MILSTEVDKGKSVSCARKGDADLVSYSFGSIVQGTPSSLDGHSLLARWQRSATTWRLPHSQRQEIGMTLAPPIPMGNLALFASRSSTKLEVPSSL